jgi:hypothetical protein
LDKNNNICGWHVTNYVPFYLPVLKYYPGIYLEGVGKQNV